MRQTAWSYRNEKKDVSITFTFDCFDPEIDRKIRDLVVLLRQAVDEIDGSLGAPTEESTPVLPFDRGSKNA